VTDDDNPFKHHRLDQSSDGLDEAYEEFVSEYLDYTARVLFGPPGRLLAASDVWYEKQHPDHVVVFNANVCIDGPRKIWFGDVDLTDDERRLAVLAKALNTKVYVLAERDGRFGGRDENPLLDKAVLVVAPDGRVEHGPHVRRGDNGRLGPAT
jgi:hypothetical protein